MSDAEPKRLKIWPVGVAGLIAFGFGMIVGHIDSALWGIVGAIVGAALSVSVAILATRLMPE